MNQKLVATAADIKRSLEQALQRREECVAVQVERVYATAHGPSNWDADITPKDEGVISAECKRLILAAKHGIQSRYELAAD